MSADRLGALIGLLQALKARHYRFITPTPATHARVIVRRDKATSRDLRDVFGWSLPFSANAIDAAVLTLMRDADVVETHGDQLKSRVRVSSLGDDLFVHSAFPTTQNDAVFFGPDSYRFARFIAAELPRFGPTNRLVDIGTGSGVGAVAALHAVEARRVIVSDVNQRALDFAAANIAASDISNEHDLDFFDTVRTSGLDAIDAPIHAIIANPPYIIDDTHRAYRDGGGMHGAELSLAWAEAAAEKLALGGVLLLYTGSAIVGGEDRFEKAVREMLRGFDVSYREIDPDVFGEELERDAYADVERIAVVGLVAVKR